MQFEYIISPILFNNFLSNEFKETFKSFNSLNKENEKEGIIIFDYIENFEDKKWREMTGIIEYEIEKDELKNILILYFNYYKIENEIYNISLYGDNNYEINRKECEENYRYRIFKFNNEKKEEYNIISMLNIKDKINHKIIQNRTNEEESQLLIKKNIKKEKCIECLNIKNKIIQIIIENKMFNICLNVCKECIKNKII